MTLGKAAWEARRGKLPWIDTWEDIGFDLNVTGTTAKKWGEEYAKALELA